MAYSKLSSLLDKRELRDGGLGIPGAPGSRGDHYDPNQPRVPAGHPDGGQWTSEGYGFSIKQTELGEVLSDVTPDNDWIPGAQYAASGNQPNIQHQQGVDAAKNEYVKRGYTVIEAGPVAVDVAGFATARYYDFIVEDPKSGFLIGIEVKTTLGDTIRLNSDQVAKDVVVVQKGGRMRTSRLDVRGVGYITYCKGCDAVDLRSFRLHSTLKAFKIPFTHGGRPGETLP